MERILKKEIYWGGKKKLCSYFNTIWKHLYTFANNYLKIRKIPAMSHPFSNFSVLESKYNR